MPLFKNLLLFGILFFVRELTVFLGMYLKRLLRNIFYHINDLSSLYSAYFENIAETVSKKKIGLLVTAADYYINSNKCEREVRFDIITILKKNDRYIIEHLEDAFYHF